MCCSVSADTVAYFGDTLLYAAEAVHPDLQKTVHVLGYQNTVQDNVNKQPGLLNKLFKNLRFSNPFSSPPDIGFGNAMFLPFPARPGTMSKLNIIDTENFPNFLIDISIAAQRQPERYSDSVSFSVPENKREVEIFEAAGIYTVILAQNIEDIPHVLSEIPIRKRPNPNPAIFEAYAEWYPDWTFALCCFNNEDKKTAHPMLWWYEPMFSDILFLPALDSHDGSVPQLDAQVEVDHIIAVGSTEISETERVEFTDSEFPDFRFVDSEFPNFRLTESKYSTVNYSDGSKIPPSVKRFLVDNILGGRIHKKLKNGDFYFRLSEIRKGTFKPIRHFSPNAAGIAGQ